jgi:hypothetical protein
MAIVSGGGAADGILEVYIMRVTPLNIIYNYITSLFFISFFIFSLDPNLRFSVEQ